MYPKHVGVIMDGNGRWATKRGLPRTAGHYEGVKAAKRVTTEASRLGIPYITYYVFSTENWNRPKKEVAYLMDLLASRLYSEIDFYKRVGARVLIRGDITTLTNAARDAVIATQDATAHLDRLTVSLAISHGGHDEIVRSVNRWLEKRADDARITATDIRSNIDLAFIPPVDLIIRSGGEKRLSNFMLWDAAYAEFAFYDTLWPDWGAKELQSACDDFAHRARRFGGVPT
ncbi:MAG: di-trans,poly-cis-decaprenylcistransferase [Spirochaetae bacterium HGW-Spirochaetae-4]|nr:MAG: di-trans,poly-cis-decaprenylcistransferase [Spirochaetes bacterium GWC2_52_13]PKL11989.1 MAG: di-trans,poly-cis-decaprenylcistransferase [Spirochaetae bacterium HGW-Spirochaetae-8]PKL21329.1 MAG: di-trans,poly-cis-decaprenylcistransferase [Spirochaetae bacterium HGW-Spirochaetae-4]HCG64291.1 di-trans,poly-cis-decaprenylcistransferase [Sphaerochaeta sp.]HCS37337.1 di-trans,poly-cis-decaprenylcistransferase [Sphaerochaeta sp.]